MGRLTAFDLLFDEAAPLVRQDRHRIESPPVDGGRWPVSVVLRPDQLNLGRAVMDSAELVRFRYEDGPAGRLMRPEVLATARTRTVHRTRTVQTNPEAPTADLLS